MGSLDRRRSLPAALGAAFLLYLVAGHAFHPGQTMDEATVGAGICIVLVTVLAIAFLPPPPLPAVAPIAAVPRPRPSRRRALVAARARPSPVLLQRFLN